MFWVHQLLAHSCVYYCLVLFFSLHIYLICIINVCDSCCSSAYDICCIVMGTTACFLDNCLCATYSVFFFIICTARFVILSYDIYICAGCFATLFCDICCVLMSTTACILNNCLCATVSVSVLGTV